MLLQLLIVHQYYLHDALIALRELVLMIHFPYNWFLFAFAFVFARSSQSNVTVPRKHGVTRSEIGPGRTGHRLFQEYTTMMLHQQVRPFTVVEEPNLIQCHVPTFGWTKRSVRDAHQEKNWRIPTYPATTRVKESDTICKPAL